MKKCSKCKAEKEYHLFSKDSNKKLGLSSQCKDCRNSSIRKYYKENPDKLKESNKKSYLNNRDKRLAYAEEYRSKNRDKILSYQKKNGSHCVTKSNKKHRNASLCRQRTNYRIKTGELIRPSICQNCLKEGEIHGHHCDYNKPYDLMWLCKVCHYEWHKNNKAKNSETGIFTEGK